MSNVKLKKGIAETALAKELWHRGIRYRRNYRDLPGSPDIAITKNKVAIFVDGEFWHGHDWENRKEKLQSNKDYWIEKIEENIRRDARNDCKLEKAGWTSMHFWEKELKSNLQGCVEKVLAVLGEH
ncbi:MAG: very short patch repair endonuclease [Candidatus Gracilibacteria bacterium]|nr:very short patch repair endonuclease [Candidatus Gracilibacteria bacterium]